MFDAAIYLDHAASTPLHSDVLQAMIPYYKGAGNPHARHHSYGIKSAKALETASQEIAANIHAAPEQLIFTSGATEANNLALKGLANRLKSSGKTHIISSLVEHKCVLEPLRELEKTHGFKVTLLQPKSCGMIERRAVEKALTDDTGLVSIQAVNNELGTIQPLSEIADILKNTDIFFHTDAAQALGKIEIDVDLWGVDFISLSAHKAYGPQGIGALYMRYSQILTPIITGGGQENGLRAGTLPTALCVGFGKACSLLDAGTHRAKHQKMRDHFLQKIAPHNPLIHGHSDPEWNVPNILNLRFAGIDNETLVMALPHLAFGTGSACSAQSNIPSHVIKATESEEAALEAIRISWGE